MKKVRLAIIGAGFVSQLAHLPSFYSNPKVKIVALCDLNKKLLDKVSKKFQIFSTYTSHREMLRKEQLDAVILVVQRSKIESVAMDVLKAGIPLLSEKPAALSYSSAKKLCDLAKKNKTKYLIGYMKRHDNGILFLKKNLKKFRLGKLLTVYYETFLGDSYSNPFEYFKQEDKDYRKKNTLNKKFTEKKLIFIKYLNTFCHSINLIRYLFGELKIEYKALSGSGEGCVFFRSKNGTSIILNNQYSESKKWIERIHLNFESGKILVKLPTPLLKNTSTSLTVDNYKSGNVQKPWITWGWSFKNQAKSFIDYIISNKTNTLKCRASDCLNDIKIIESIFKD